MDNKENFELWQEIIDYLQGTCKGFDEVLTEFKAEDLLGHMPFHYELDNQIFLCDCCNWWCEISEASEANEHEDYGQDICNDCYEDC